MTDYQALLGLSYIPSTYQAAIFDFVREGRGHAVVRAVAGSGKTTTIVSAAKLIKGAGAFFAFNKLIAGMLSNKLAGTSMTASTVHSHGFAAIRSVWSRVKVDASKYRAAIDELADEVTVRGRLLGDPVTKAELDAVDDEGFPRAAMRKLVDLARLTMLDEQADDFGAHLLELVERHDIEFDPRLDQLVVDCIRYLMAEGARTLSVIDYTDMVWIPARDPQIRPRTYSWVFVDECQDLSAAALALITRSVRRGGRMLFVGDDRQAIYGFAGSDADSFANIVELVGGRTLPLSVCYRCPTAVLEKARTICPEIEARPGAPAGVVREASRDEAVAEVREGDMVLCRVNAPLLSLCFELLAEGVPATVRGRSIGEGLIKIVRKVSRRLRSFGDFRGALDQWEDGEVERAERRYRNADARDAKIESVRDQAECLRVIASRSASKSPVELEASIAELFSDGRQSVALSSIHRAKGLEAERVFILEPERLDNPRAKRAWQFAQERNLAYVAYTRAQAELIEIV